MEWQRFEKPENKRQIYMTVRLGGLTAIHFSLICMTVRLEWTDCHTFVSYFMAVRLGWTDCHTFFSYLYDSKAWVD